MLLPISIFVSFGKMHFFKDFIEVIILSPKIGKFILKVRLFRFGASK